MTCVLVVDDDLDVRRLKVSELVNAEYQVETAEIGVQAILHVIDADMDAVVLAIHMPHLDGVNALRILRRLAPMLPVIVMTGRANRMTCLRRCNWTPRPAVYGSVQPRTMLRVLLHALEHPSHPPSFEEGHPPGSPPNATTQHR